MTPNQHGLTATGAAAGFGGGVVEYGAHHKTPAEGAALARVRAEDLLREAERQRLRRKSSRTRRPYRRVEGR